MSIEIEILLAVFGVVTALIGALLMIIWRMLNDKIRHVEEITLAQKHDLDTERKERSDKHDKIAEKVFDRIDKNERAALARQRVNEEQLNDMTATIAGFGGVYITRNEFQARLDHESPNSRQ